MIDKGGVQRGGFGVSQGYGVLVQGLNGLFPKSISCFDKLSMSGEVK